MYVIHRGFDYISVCWFWLTKNASAFTNVLCFGIALQFNDNNNSNNNDNNNNNNNEKLKEKFGSGTRKTFDRFTTKDSYTWNITHNTESTAV